MDFAVLGPGRVVLTLRPPSWELRVSMFVLVLFDDIVNITLLIYLVVYCRGDVAMIRMIV